MNIKDIKCIEIQNLIMDKYASIIEKAIICINNNNEIKLNIPSQGLVYNFKYIKNIKTIGVTCETIKETTIFIRGYKTIENNELIWNDIFI